MTITTTDHARWPNHPADVPRGPAFVVAATVLEPVSLDPVLAERMQRLTEKIEPVGDPQARARMAAALHQLGGWGVFATDADRAYVSRLWAQDWDSPEDQVYDRPHPGASRGR